MHQSTDWHNTTRSMLHERSSFNRFSRRISAALLLPQHHLAVGCDASHMLVELWGSRNLLILTLASSHGSKTIPKKKDCPFYQVPVALREIMKCSLLT
jgi:hypothetical protein